LQKRIVAESYSWNHMAGAKCDLLGLWEELVDNTVEN
jgi:hypothetical protein